MLLVLVLILTLFFLLGLKLFAASTGNFWKKKGIPHEKPWPILGNMTKWVFRRKSFADLLRDSYQRFPKERYYGFYEFSKPTLMIRDPDLIKDILIKNFDHFRDRSRFLPESSDGFWNKSIFSLEGKDWHDMRCCLSPLFTGNKIRSYYTFMKSCAQNYVDHFKSLNDDGKTIELDVRLAFLRYTNDVIASAIFGLEVNSIKDQDNECYTLGSKYLHFEGLKGLKFFGQSISPGLMRFLGIKFFDGKFENFFTKLVDDSIKHREATGYVRPDMIHFLHQAQKGRNIRDDKDIEVDTGFATAFESNTSDSKLKITNHDIAAQAAIFYFGGFDTVGLILAHAAHELAVAPDIQSRLISEIDETLKENEGNVTYESVVQMKYLDMVISETLRMWSPGLMLIRKCVKDYTIQPQTSQEKVLIIEKGTTVNVPSTFGIHRDPKYYPNPDKFDPERFSQENKHKIRMGTYLPFGLGPRNCLASRFGIVESKVMMFMLLADFEIVPVAKTQIPLVLSAKIMPMGSENGYWVGLKPRK